MVREELLSDLPKLFRGDNFQLSLFFDMYYYKFSVYSSVRVIASRILHEICLLIGELAIRGTNLTLNARLGTKSNLLIDEYC